MTDFSYLKNNCLHCGGVLGENADSSYGLHTVCFLKVFEIEESEAERTITGVAKLLTTARAGSADEAHDDSVRDAQFHGNYPKYSIKIGGKEYIAKLGKSNDFNLIALAEMISNRVALRLGLNVPQFSLIFWKNRPCFVVKNFMTSSNPSNLIPLENYWPRKSDGKMTEYEIKELFSIVKERSSYLGTVQMVCLIIFDYLIGNADRHRGNIAFIQDKKGTRLAPIYDNVTDLGLEQEDFLSPDDRHHPSMRVQVADARDVSAKVYLESLMDLGFDVEVGDFVKKLDKELPKILKEIDSAFYLTPNLKATFRDLVSRRQKEIAEYMENRP